MGETTRECLPGFLGSHEMENLKRRKDQPEPLPVRRIRSGNYGR